MHDSDLYTVAAGNGSRLRADLPKALVPILEEPCLTTTLTLVSHKFRRVFIITNVVVQNLWSTYFGELGTVQPELAKRIVNVPITSGLGDGHATLHGMLAAERTERTVVASDVVIMWGDAFLPSGDLLDELLSIPNDGSGVVPARMENNPYVCLRVNQQMQCVAADFSKYGERHPTGWHDQSAFRFARLPLLGCLLELHRCLWKYDRYLSPGGELPLLYAFHSMYNAGRAVQVYETSEATRSFNTNEEVYQIRREQRIGREVLTR